METARRSEVAGRGRGGRDRASTEDSLGKERNDSAGDYNSRHTAPGVCQKLKDIEHLSIPNVNYGLSHNISTLVSSYRETYLRQDGNSERRGS